MNDTLTHRTGQAPADRISALATGLELLASGYWPLATYPAGTSWPDGRVLDDYKTPIGKDWGRVRWTRARLEAAYNRYPSGGSGVCLGPGRGPGGTWLIDLEGDGPGAAESMARLFGGEDITTPSWTATRGNHALFTADGATLLDLLAAAGGSRRKGAGRAGTWTLADLPGLEFRVGGYRPDGTVKSLQSVVPPTPGTDDRTREWLFPPTVSIAEFPGAGYAFLEALAERKAIQEEPPLDRHAIEPVEAPRDRRAVSVGRSYGATALEAEVTLVAAAAEGHRHDTLRSAALRVAGLAKAGLLEWGAARDRLAEAAGRAGLPEAEARDTIAWAWSRAQSRKTTHIALGNPKADSIWVTSIPAGASLARVKQCLATTPVPPGLIGNLRLEPIARAMAALAAEATRRGQTTFHAAARLIAELAGHPNHRTVLRRLAALGGLGYVSLIEAGTPGSGPTGKASTWRWHDTPMPGETAWNSATTTTTPEAAHA